MANVGWIKLHRSLMDNQIWLSEPFTKAQAWVDLLMLASGCDDGHYQRGKVYRGKEWLANRWGWDRGKVRRFIDRLERDGMVTQNRTHGGTRNGTVITIVNWEKYQGSRPQNAPQNAPQNQPPKRNKEYNKPPKEGGMIILDEDEDDSTYIDPLELLKRDKEAGYL